jgi:methylated-DNA-[protein]-cysteine S-methyltransferase
MKTIFITEFETDFGTLILGDFEGKLCLCDWKFRKMRTQINQRIKTGLQAEFQSKTTELLIETQRQLNAYFVGETQVFDLPLQFVGTEFQQKVWNQLLEIKFGETDSYLSLSKKLANQKAIRAVASANGANAISIIVPCHRIIGSNGELIGYAGGLAAKKKLLELENPALQNQLSLF